MLPRPNSTDPNSNATLARSGDDFPLWILFPLFFVLVWLSHATLIRLPYFWDEAGYYIPAAWDFWRTGTLIPFTTLSNAHPPLPSILLAAWWHLSGFVPSGTRTFCCMVAAAALLAVFRLARGVAGTPVAIVTVLLTALYPVWFAQSTLAHADLFAAAFTLWGLSLYFVPTASSPDTSSRPFRDLLLAAALFSLAALSKETAIVTPVSLALWETWQALRPRAPHLAPDQHAPNPKATSNPLWIPALLAPILPLLAWYAFHYARTGFVFGNPDFLRYNATANLSLHRVLLSLWHRLLHLTVHLNLFVPVLCALSAALMPGVPDRRPLPRRILLPFAVLLLANLLEFSFLGGALLTRYLLPMFPLVLLLCVSTWRAGLRPWGWMAGLSAAALAAALWINPPYAFAPEDNLTYRDFIVLHQQAVALIATRFPNATVLTAWPATEELRRPELGYTRTPIHAIALQNFSLTEIQKAQQNPAAFDTALLFSTKWAPPGGELDLGAAHQSADAQYFDFHRDLPPAEVATLLHGEILWHAQRKGEWAAILRFPHTVNATPAPRLNSTQGAP